MLSCSVICSVRRASVTSFSEQKSFEDPLLVETPDLKSFGGRDTFVLSGDPLVLISVKDSDSPPVDKRHK